jgi:hypothetical protein
LWLDKRGNNKPGSDDDLTRGIVRACLAGMDGKREEAVTQFKALRSELKKKKYAGSVAEEVDFFIQRFGNK